MPDSAIPWIMRRDLELYTADDVEGGWTIRDPVRLNYFRVEAEELEFLHLLDGQRSLPAIVERLKLRFPDLQFAAHNLAMFLSTAVRAGLLIPTGPGYGAQLVETSRRERSSAARRKIFSLISHRVRGIDPTPLLRRLDHVCGWIFHRRLLQLAILFVAVMTLLVLLRWNQLMMEMPSISALFTLQNAVVLGIIIACIKVVHEIGHALTCYHHGGECHELGCIVVGILPLLYCDVSDSWKQHNRVQRMQVAAAGIFVELFLAAVCGLLWMLSVPGPLHAAFLNVMLVCSFSTVLVNGNPLLRYDGYYVLSDALRLPNLGPESRQAALDLFDRVVLGIPRPSVSLRSGRQRLGLPLFGLASMIYRLLVLVTIVLVLHSTLKPWRLEPVVGVLALSAAAGLLLGWFRLLRQRLAMVSGSGQQALRAVIGLLVGSGLTALLILWPLPHTIDMPFTLTPGDSAPVYVSSAGRLVDSVAYGSSVESGQPLVRLQNTELELSIVRLEGQLKLQEARLENLASARGNSSRAAMAIPAATQGVRNLQERLSTLRQKADRLTLLSVARGELWPPRRRPHVGSTGFDLQTWQERPLDSANESAWLEEQTLLGWVGGVAALRATVYVPQQDVEFVSMDAPTVVMFHSQPGNTLTGQVVAISSLPESTAPAELQVNGALAVGQDGRLSETRFLVHVAFRPDQQPIPPLYSTGLATIRCRKMSLVARGWRLLNHTFAFEL